MTTNANLTARATEEAVLAAGRATRARTGVASATTLAPDPDPFRRPTPTDIGWDVAGSSSCDLRAVLHADPRGRGFWLVIPDSVAPVTSPNVELGFIADRGGTDATQSIADIVGTYTTGAAIATAIAARINAATPSTAPAVVEATASSYDGGGLVFFRGLRAADDETASAGPGRYGVCYLAVSEWSAGVVLSDCTLIREVPEGAFVRVWTRPTARLADLVLPAPYDTMIGAWAQAADYGQVGPGGVDERLNIGARAAVWCELYGVDWSGDDDVTASVDAVVDAAAVLVAPATTEAP